MELIDAQGTVFKRGTGTGSPETFAEILGVKTFNGPGGSTPIRDASTLKSTRKEKKPGLPDSGQLTLNLFFDPGDTVHQGLRADWAARTRRNFQMILVDGTEWAFAGYVVSCPVQGGVDADLESTVTIEIDGEITES